MEYCSSPELLNMDVRGQQNNEARANERSQNADTGTLYCYKDIPCRYEFRIRIMGHANVE